MKAIIAMIFEVLLLLLFFYDNWKLDIQKEA